MGAGGERFGWWYDGEKRGDGSAESFCTEKKNSQAGHRRCWKFRWLARNIVGRPGSARIMSTAVRHPPWPHVIWSAGQSNRVLPRSGELGPLTKEVRPRVACCNAASAAASSARDILDSGHVYSPAPRSI